MSKNPGKVFEECLIKSIDQSHVLVKRLNDNAASFGQSSSTRFASTNECDFLMYENNSRTFYGLELKSIGHDSLTYWREDFEVKIIDENGKEKTKKQSFNIRKCQIEGLKKWSENYNGVFGLIINFRSKNNRTFFVYIDEFLKYTNGLDKKSINFNDILKMKPIEISCELKRVNYKYDMNEFFNKTCNVIE